MALDDVLKGFEEYQKIAGIADAATKDVSNPDTLNEFLGYCKKVEKLGDAELQSINQIARRDLIGYREMIGGSLNQKTEKAIDNARQNYTGLVAALSDDTLRKIASGLPSKDKKYLWAEEALKNGEVGALKEAFASQSESPVWKRAVELMGEEEINGYVGAYRNREIKKFVNQKLSDEVLGKDGKKEYKFNRKKATDYITSYIDSQKDKDKSGYYLQLAGILYKQEQDKKKAKKK